MKTLVTSPGGDRRSGVRTLPAWLVALLILSAAVSARAKEIAVVSGARGDGSRGAPLGSVQQALDVAQRGDVIVVFPGTYTEVLRTVRPGVPGAPIVVRSAGGPATTVVTSPRGVVQINHSHVTIEGIALDGQYGPERVVVVRAGVSAAVLRDVEVRRSGRDCVWIQAARQILIEAATIHHCLNPRGGRTDAHGIVAGAVAGLTIRHTEIHTFSGDAIQLDPGRNSPGWTDVEISGCRLWLEPLREAANGFEIGVVPGENAVDTKTWAQGPRASLTIRDTTAWGFQNGLISNMSAFNLKEKIDARVDRVTVRDSAIAFRVRGATRRGPGAWITISNAVVHRGQYRSALRERHRETVSVEQHFWTSGGAPVSLCAIFLDPG